MVRAQVTTSTQPAPAARSASAHASAVAPVVKTSSTRRMDPSHRRAANRPATFVRRAASATSACLGPSEVRTSSFLTGTPSSRATADARRRAGSKPRVSARRPAGTKVTRSGRSPSHRTSPAKRPPTSRASPFRPCRFSCSVTALAGSAKTTRLRARVNPPRSPQVAHGPRAGVPQRAHQGRSTIRTRCAHGSQSSPSEGAPQPTHRTGAASSRIARI